MSTNGTNRSVINCPHCKQRFTAVMPTPAIFNDLRSSALVAPHEKPIRCICGGHSVAVLSAAEMTWAIVPITEAQAAQLEDSSIIIPPMVVQ